MLTLNGICKTYKTGGISQTVLDNVSLSFRDNEFVAILGPSGSGKTTLLNIIGGLDHSNAGELIINGVSTRKYKDRDWDAYRNHSIGFVFQSYNLISHQTILSNVELALTISGVSAAKRKALAKEALTKVGLGEHMHKKPNQLSGGQMQRVALARALINNPDILLADEPTGALDTATGIQVMELLKEVAKDRLVIMVTHNPELADAYANRIVRLVDGRVTEDSNPFNPEAAPAEHKRLGKASMSFWTSLGLSFQNLRTKKGRTVMTSLAGSIGIIGIALILSLSNGVNSYITDLQKNTMSAYPITVEPVGMDMTGLIKGVVAESSTVTEHEGDAVYADTSSFRQQEVMNLGYKKNNLTAFKAYLDNPDSDIRAYIGESGIVYSYDLNFTVKSGETELDSQYFEELLPGEEGVSGALRKSYDVVYGSWPEAYNEIVLVLNSNNELSAETLLALGLMDDETYASLAGGNTDWSLSYEDVCKTEISLLPACDGYVQLEDGTWTNAGFNEETRASAISLKIVGVLRPASGELISSISAPFGYLNSLTAAIMQRTQESPAVQAQKANPDINILTGKAFNSGLLDGILGGGESYEQNLALLGAVDADSPASISIYADSFEEKDQITACIANYNENAEEDDKIIYTDYMAILLKSVTTIVSAVSYVLIAFVAVSLVVSSIMIGIITFISVLERTKEIGILRALGASKGNVSGVFKAETVLIGLFSGLLGIAITELFLVPANAVIHTLTGSKAISAALPLPGAIILIVLSTLLTLIGGLLPAKKAARQDPVAALRGE